MAKVESIRRSPRGGTGVRASLTSRRGLDIALAAEALRPFRKIANVRAAVEWDAVSPRLHLVSDRRQAGKTPLEWTQALDGAVCSIGHRAEWAGAAWFRDFDCVWRVIPGGLEIDLPREMLPGALSVSAAE